MRYWYHVCNDYSLELIGVRTPTEVANGSMRCLDEVDGVRAYGNCWDEPVYASAASDGLEGYEL